MSASRTPDGIEDVSRRIDFVLLDSNHHPPPPTHQTAGLPLESLMASTLLSSLFTIFPLNPFSAPQRRATRSEQTECHGSFGVLPADILAEISLYLDCVDLQSVVLLSNHIYGSVTPVLYRRVVLTSFDKCCTTLNMLGRRPDIARHVQDLLVSPRSPQRARHVFSDSAVISDMVRSLAASETLLALSKFTWADEELPFYDDMWFALRAGCEQLKYISTTIGSYSPASHSHLFDFKNLTGFCLHLEPSFYHDNLHLSLDHFFDMDYGLTRPFWDMLLNQCPDLQELRIEGRSPFPVDVNRLTDGRWPKLRTLVLGDVSADWVPRGAHLVDKRPFANFLEAHPTLETLELSQFSVSPTTLRQVNPQAMKITSFSGTLDQLHALPHMYGKLRSLSFRDPLQTREVTAFSIAGLLQHMPNLTDLRVAFVLHSSYDSQNILRSLTNACPKLQNLELRCTQKQSFSMLEFSKCIRCFTKLRTLQLAVVKSPGDSLARSAAQIARVNPRLENFTLTFLPPMKPRYLPVGVPASATGRFTLVTDTHGLPLSLSAYEQQRVAWPMGLGVSRSSRKYVSDLRPAGTPGRRAGLLALMTEKSAAGEEMRVIVFCTILVFLAGYGFATR
ncbi:hypothetical protein BD626DRAFT_473844 [Schizophyllum amplum]|uniref:F-box domain-containing protein n=1 Tax=Schizophyllum amplum TaxID=97359 RepID=A0A550CX66_9AGAR|nr:hypothetical protein BD626DRAFT_473844 [Auriculariopsis ampla]